MLDDVKFNLTYMQNDYPRVWVSSINHMDAFSQITKANPWWKVLLVLNKIPAGFPQIKIGIRKYPVVFYAEGSLTLFERQLAFKADKDAQLNNYRYSNLKTDLKFEMDYTTLKVERFVHPKPFMKAFNLNWIKLSPSNNDAGENILLSCGGSGFQKRRIETLNDEIFQIIQQKVTPSPPCRRSL